MEECEEDHPYALFVLGALVLSITENDVLSLADMVLPYVKEKFEEWQKENSALQTRLLSLIHI